MKGKVAIGCGAILMVLALLMMVGLVPDPLATVIYTQGIVATRPQSWSLDSPTPLPTNEQYYVWVKARDDDRIVTSATCDITAGEYTEFIQLTWFSYDWQSSDPTKKYVTYRGSWSAPNLEENVFKFLFKIFDVDGNLVDEQEAYGLQGDYPDGYFTINGIRVDPTSVIYVDDPTLALQFHATEAGNLITSTYVYIEETNKCVDLAEVTSDTVWEGTYTLPSTGTYTLEGVMELEGPITYVLMSVVVGWGEGEVTFKPQEPTLASVSMLLAGLVLIGVGVYWEKES